MLAGIVVVIPAYLLTLLLAFPVAVLAASQTVPAEQVAGVVHLGELGLDGRIAPSPRRSPPMYRRSRPVACSTSRASCRSRTAI